MNHLESLQSLHLITGEHIEAIEAGVSPASMDWKPIVKTILSILLQLLSTPTAKG